MKKKCVIFSIITVFIVLLISAIIIIKQLQKNKLIDTVYDTLDNNINNINSIDDLYLKIDGNNVIGVIEIESINYKGLIYESTNMDILDKGIGHFESSPLFEGNVCLAGHNYYNIWSKLHTLKKGDLIKYTSVLGSKTYSVFNIKQIDDTDTSVLDDTIDDMITLITCIKNTPNRRLCVQAISI